MCAKGLDIEKSCKRPSKMNVQGLMVKALQAKGDSLEVFSRAMILTLGKM
jgi:hypothetical protein